ncbi:tripartite motif-containing protein 16-like [Garra rufa]|uniref:tripartite motif-containing protein 16-like n=1 Tax=Garra rufa TaxID=137080 RepID=UPI003CCEEC2F
MAEARFSQDELMCPVCLDLLKDPVSIQCGHSYCKSCITGCWDQEDQMRVYSCPQCRQIFSPRPALGKNTMLAELVEKLKKTKLPADCDAGAGDVQCDQLKETQKTFQQRIQQREKDVQQLRETVESHKRSAQTAVEDSERIFTELIRSIERSRSELIRLIRDQEKTAVSRAEERLERLEQEINDLRRRDDELEQLSHTQDHIQFSLSAPPESTDVNDDPFSSVFSFNGLTESAHQLRDKLEDFCKEELKKISDRAVVCLSLYSFSQMAEARFSQDELTCPVCLDLLKDPVSIQCGHSYCKSCITSCWDQEDQMRVYSCPQCRQTFSPRPALGKNTMLAELVEKLKKTKLPADCDAGAGDVQCDVCTGRKYKAVKSCLVCLNSYCQNHLEQHESFFKGKRHNLIDATGRLQEMICQKHEKVLEVFCRTDQKCICMLCTMDEHKNHDTVSAAAQRTEKQKQLKEMQKSFQQRIQQREKDVQQLRETVESHKRSAQTAVEDSERIFTELIRSIERSRSELIRLIRDQEKTAVSRAEERLERLEQEINDLRRRDDELEQLSHTQDHIQFLQSFQSLSAPPESTDVNDDPFSSVFSFDGLKESVHQLRDKLEDFCKEQLKKISDRVTSTNIVPRTRKDFLQYSHQLTLDLNTVYKQLRLSESNRVITNTGSVQSYPDHPDRFDYWWQLLCRESVCGRCYWELEWSGNYVYISVSYKSISRKGSGNKCLLGCNNQSWSLYCNPSKYLFGHNNKWTDLPVKPISSRIGVYVDHSAGTLSFYSVSDTMSLIHTVQTTFTQPLYPGFMVSVGSSVKLC